MAAENIIVIQKNYLNLNHFQLSSDNIGYPTNGLCYAWNTVDRVAAQQIKSADSIVFHVSIKLIFHYLGIVNNKARSS